MVKFKFKPVIFHFFFPKQTVLQRLFVTTRFNVLHKCLVLWMFNHCFLHQEQPLPPETSPTTNLQITLPLEERWDNCFRVLSIHQIRRNTKKSRKHLINIQVCMTLWLERYNDLVKLKKSKTVHLKKRICNFLLPLAMKLVQTNKFPVVLTELLTPNDLRQLIGSCYKQTQVDITQASARPQVAQQQHLYAIRECLKPHSWAVHYLRPFHQFRFYLDERGKCLNRL